MAEGVGDEVLANYHNSDKVYIGGKLMPAYISSPQVSQVVALYPGNRLALVNNAATDSGITTTLQFANGPVPNQSGNTIVINNTTNQQAQGQYCDSDTAANYENLSGCVVPANSSLPYNLSGGWMRFTFSVAPTSGSLIVSK
jgi:hypothetical protein